MAFYYVNDGVVDTAVSFQEDEAQNNWAWWLRASVVADDVTFREVGRQPGFVIDIPAPQNDVQAHESAVVAFNLLSQDYEQEGWWQDDAVTSTSGTLVGSITVTGDFAGTHSAAGVSGTLDGSVTITGTFAGAHGVAGPLVGTIQPVGTLTGGHGVAGPLVGTVTPIGLFAGAQGVTGTLDGIVPLQSAFVATHGQAGVVAGTVPISGAFSGTHTPAGTVGTLSGQIVPVGTFAGLHSITGQINGTIQPVGGFTAAHGVTGTMAGTVVLQSAFNGTFTAVGANGAINGVVPVIGAFDGFHPFTETVTGGSYADVFGPRKRKARQEVEIEELEKPVPKAKAIGKSEPVIETGIIQSPGEKPYVFKPKTDVLVEIETKRQKRQLAESKRKQKIRAIQMADDEWLLMM